MSAELREAWLARWPAALASWSRFTRLRPPTLCLSEREAHDAGLSGSFAMIRLEDQTVVVSLPGVVRAGLQDYAHEVLAHEIGHHVLAPANLTDHARTIARMRWALPTREQHAPLVANLYTDLLINDRLQRSAGLRMAEVFRALGANADAGGALWAVYLRVYELLWSLPRGALGAARTDDRQEGDALLGARLVRSYASDWIDGSGRFAALLLPYLLEDTRSQELLERLFDTRAAGAGGEPAGLSEEEPGERAGAVHPASEESPPAESARNSVSAGQSREPFQYGELLRASGLDLSEHQAAVRYYRERALPHLVRYPTRPLPASVDLLPEGLEPWDLGEPLDTIDWLQTLAISPRVIPGVTTVQRVWGTTEAHEPEREPLDLDLYVDSSGSMPDPRRQLSFTALAGAIVCLSALRAGARVQATLWSGAHECLGTAGFVRDEHALLEVLTDYFGGGTAFPIHRLRDTHAARSRADRAVHVLLISDDGVATLFDRDERGQDGWIVAGAALERARGGGTMVLNLPQAWDRQSDQSLTRIRRARDEQGWSVHRVTEWSDLIAFAREFSRRRYGPAGE